jgi:hypothetical protein
MLSGVNPLNDSSAGAGRIEAAMHIQSSKEAE